MRDLIYREFRHSPPCRAIGEDGEYSLFCSKDIYIGSARLEGGFYKFIARNKECREGNQRFISYVLNSLNNCLVTPKDYYVYVVYVDKVLRYIGKGFGKRFMHAVSGTSHSYDLNRAYFSKSVIEVFCFKDCLDEQKALTLESDLICMYGGVTLDGLYNSIGPKECRIIETADDSMLYHRLKSNRCLIAVKVSDEDEYEFCEDYQENYKFHFKGSRQHDSVQ